VEVPVQLAHGARLDMHQGRGDGRRRREIRRVGDPHPAAGRNNRLLRHHPVAERLRHRACSRTDGVVGQRLDLALENVAFVVDVDRNVGKCTFRNAEVLGQHLARHVREQVREQKGLVFRKTAVVEDQEEFAAVVEALDRMRNYSREIPQIAGADIVDEGASLFVDGRNARMPGEHVGPFGLLVPMHLADAAGIESHIHAGELGCNRQLTHRHLARPGAGQETIVRRSE